uniref:Leucine-rich repeat-containing protein 49-like n=1 Tax=Castor canadensis TaxID=51338 RepID=A0A8B7V9U8_CASCN|nr:leucine-rich repeat-containing protein 49-like [Castor canadensis]
MSLDCAEASPARRIRHPALSSAMIPGKYRSVSGRAANNVNCGLHLVIQASTLPEKNKVEFRINRETPSFPGRLLQHDLERNYSSRQGIVGE